MRTMRLKDFEADVEAAIADVQDVPVLVQSDGKDVAIVLSPDLYEMLVREPPPGVNPHVAALFKRSLVERAQVYRALARYEAEHPDGQNDERE